MAQIAHPQSQVIHVSRRTMRVAGSTILALLVAAAIVLAFTLPDDKSASVTSRSASPVVAPDARFDGGPNEGTRGVANVSPITGVRFDGGPQEGTRGRAAVAIGTRFDGGPEEGSRGAR